MNLLKEKAKNLPTQSGVYQFLNKEGEVIYVGKAVNLKSRVSSYFNSSADHSIKVRAMVRHIVDIKHIVVGGERDALLLENNLIKELQPRYNILLKDSKTYPWICITREPFPRVISTRVQYNKQQGEYFGPYASVGVQRSLLQMLHTVYPLRSCKLNLTPENIKKGKYSVCLKFHMGHCRGGCVGKETEGEYMEYIGEVREILRGRFSIARRGFEGLMQEAVEGLNFELAEGYKRKLLALMEYRQKSEVVSNQLGTLDVVNIEHHPDTSFGNHLRVVDGAVVGCYTFELKGRLEESPGQLLSFALSQLELTAPEIVVPFLPTNDYIEENTAKKCFTPQRGDKVRLLELSARNCKFYRLEKLKNIEKKDPEKHIERVMQNMQRELGLDAEPRHIECFDNSNIGGEFPVAACVVFRNGKPSKKEYRHFNVKTVVGADDFATMQEIVGRRYRRVLEEGGDLPDLIVIDGGKGQLGMAYRVLEELGVEDRIKIVGLAKKMEEVFFVGDPTPLYLDKKGETLRILMHARDEAHRFGITFHRNQRSKEMKKRIQKQTNKTTKKG